MELNIKTEKTVLQVKMKSGPTLNIVMKPAIQLVLSSVARAEWGNVGGDITNQADLIAMFNSKAPLVHTHTSDDVKMADDPTVTATARMARIEKLAKAGCVL